MLTVRLHVSAKTGEILKIEALTDTLIPDPNDVGGIDDEGVGEASGAREDVLAAVQEGLRGARFPTAKEDSFVTVPFLFE